MNDASKEAKSRAFSRERFFDRSFPEGYAAELAEALRAPVANEDHGGQTMLLFRIGAFRLALPCACIVAVAPMRPVCSIPHRRNTALLGLTSFAGEIIPACSLARILGIADRAGGPDARTLVLAGSAGARDRFGVPVDAVLRISSGQLQLHGEAVSADGNRIGSAWSHEVLLEAGGNWTEVLHLPTLLQRLRRALS